MVSPFYIFSEFNLDFLLHGRWHLPFISFCNNKRFRRIITFWFVIQFSQLKNRKRVKKKFNKNLKTKSTRSSAQIIYDYLIL